MSALAGFLRERALNDVQQLSESERIALALSLGDDDVRMFCAASGVDIHEAKRRLADARQVGRRFSASASRP